MIIILPSLVIYYHFFTSSLEPLLVLVCLCVSLFPRSVPDL